MFFRRHSDKLLIPIIVIVIFLLSSYRAKYHLVPDMPAAFFSSGQNHSPDKKIAAAYWGAARKELQWKYPYGHPLPPDPPAEFQIDPQALGPAASDAAVRQLYWHRLLAVWYLPEAWRKDYGWDLTWISDPADSGASWLKDEASKLFSVR